MLLRPATPSDALFIARCFHMAMLYDDVSEERLQQFASLICVRDDVLYSWRNSFLAEVEDAAGVMRPVGMVTAYDGRYYKPWQQQTFALVRQHLGIEFPGMEDEAVPGDYYIDSLAVLPEWRGRGIGTALLRHAIAEGQQRGLRVTLAVDPDNPTAQRLYHQLGFRPDGDLFIFGHTYWRMVL